MIRGVGHLVGLVNYKTGVHCMYIMLLFISLHFVCLAFVFMLKILNPMSRKKCVSRLHLRALVNFIILSSNNKISKSLTDQ